MNKYLKYSFIVSAGFISLFVLLLLVVAFTVNPNDYKPLIVKLVQEKKQRTLTLAGDIKLDLFPRIGLDLGKVSLSEHNGTAEFAAVEGVKLHVAWLPLLKKSLVVEHVIVDGIRANLVRYEDGTTNFDDLVKKEKESEIKFDIDGIKVVNSALNFDDRMGGRKLALSNLAIKSGRLKDAVPSDIELDFNAQMDKPSVTAHVQLKSGLLFELEKKHYALDGLNLELKGDAAGISGLDLSLKGDMDAKPEDKTFVGKGLKLSLTGKRGTDNLNLKLDAPKIQLTQDKVTSDKIALEARMDRAKGSIKASLTVPALEGTGQTFQASRIVLELDGKLDENEIKGKLTSPFTGNLETQRFDLDKLAATLSVNNPSLPKGNLNLTLSGDAHADLKQQDVALNATAQLDDSHIQARLGMTNFAAPAYRFEVTIDQMDVDRYLSQKPKLEGAEPEKPVDLSALQSLNATGSLRIGSLRVSNVKSSNVRLDMKAAGGKLDVNPLSANLYQGSMNGAVNLDAAATPHFTVKQGLRGVSIGPLQGQGGAELAALKGVTVPVRLAGPFASLRYTLDYK